MLQYDINLLTLLLAVIFSVILGFLWYGPLFGKAWMKLVGMTENDMQSAKEKGMGKTYASMLVVSIVTAYVLGLFVAMLDAQTFSSGMAIGFFAWLGFVATTLFNGVLFNKKPLNAYLIESSYSLTALVLMGGLFAVLG